MKRAILNLFFGISALFAFSGEIPDSLLSRLVHADGVERARIYNLLSSEYTRNEPEKRIDYAQKALQIAIENDLNEQQFHALNNLATGYSLLGNNLDALEADLRSLDIALEINNPVLISTAHNALGVDYWYMGNFERSLEHFIKSLELKKEQLRENQNQKTETGIAGTYNNIGTLYSKLGHYSKAKEYYELSMEIRIKYHDEQGVARLLNNLGALCKRQNDYKMALGYYDRSLEMRKQLGNMKEIAETLNNKGIVLQDLGETEEALQCFYESEKIFESLQDMTGLTYVAQSIADILMETGKRSEALPYINRCLDLAGKNHLTLQLSEGYLSLSHYYHLTGQDSRAYDALNTHLAYKDSLFNESLSEKIADIELKSETEAREKEIRLQQVELQKKDAVLKKRNAQRNAIAIGFALAIALVSYIYIAFRRKKKSNALLAEQKEQIEKQNEELQLLNATKDKFFNIIAHDLKGPFNAILGLSDLLFEDFENLDNEEKKEFIRNIGASSRETYKLLENLLEWARTQSGHIDFNPETIELKRFVGNLLPLFSQQLTNKNLYLKTDIAGTLKVKADTHMLNTILRNLISNAIKYSYNGGEVQISAVPEDGMVNVSVSDRGTGISGENQQRLFKIDEHFRTEGTESEKGTGLGLMLSKEFVEKHGGNIRVESRAGEGSVFTFCVPGME